MKVKYLIELLSNQNPDADVKLSEFEGSDVLFVLSRKNDANIVWIQSKDDVDLYNQIQGRYLTAAETGEAKSSLYQDLYDHGITAEEIRIAISPEESNIYRRFWEDKG